VIQETSFQRQREELLAQNRVLARVLPRAIEAKDPTTRGHADRVIAYADGLASRVGVPEKERQSLRLASLLHDIGKIAVPDTILCKSGPLTSSEREVIKRHPQEGYDMLEPLVGSEDVRTWVYQHHERWDGRGYPNGLRGEEVALPGRILILTEVFDALAEARSYKPRWSNTEIRDYFLVEAGQHFDPELAKMVADGVGRLGHVFFTGGAGLFG
jgi:HD-GYP domain-containing protein (c-di-GMP phosphodiesterase class II)